MYCDPESERLKISVTLTTPNAQVTEFGETDVGDEGEEHYHELAMANLWAMYRMFYGNERNIAVVIAKMCDFFSGSMDRDTQSYRSVPEEYQKAIDALAELAASEPEHYSQKGKRAREEYDKKQAAKAVTA